MSIRKERMTVTVDPQLVEAGNQAVAEGRADSLSAWVNAALRDRALHEQRLRSLGEAIAEYEAEYGEITDEEMAAQVRSDRAGAVVVRGRGRGTA